MSNNQKIINEIEETGFDELLPFRAYKDRIFRMLFNNPKDLLSLYNAVNGTHYDNPDELEITTLENAVFIHMKNDLSFIIAAQMCLYEHQASVCLNLPLRDLGYITALYRKLLHEQKENIYKRERITLPTPQFVVFYNGKEEIPEKCEYRLSDAYENKIEPVALELVTTVYNINKGYNNAMMERCPLLKEYMLFISRVREYRENMDLKHAVAKAVDDCIKDNILRELLMKNRAEAMEVLLYGFDQEEFEENFAYQMNKLKEEKEKLLQEKKEAQEKVQQEQQENQQLKKEKIQAQQENERLQRELEELKKKMI